jgi:hypothetical protein
MNIAHMSAFGSPKTADPRGSFLAIRYRARVAESQVLRARGANFLG